MVHAITNNNGQNDVHVDNTFIESYHVVKTVYDNLDSINKLSDQDNVYHYNTYALALADINSILADSIVEIFVDETKNNLKTSYKKENNVLVFKAGGSNVSVDSVFTPITESPGIFSPTIIRNILENKIYLNMTNPDVNGVVNLSSKIQACLNEVAKDTRRGRREVIITGKESSNLIGLGTKLVMPTKCSLIFDTDTRLIPVVNNVYGIECGATYPTSWVNLSTNGFKYLDRVIVTDASTFNIDDHIIIKSNFIIDTSPNDAGSGTKPAKVGQQCKIWAKEGNTLLLDQCLNYNYLLSDSAQVGKIINPKEDIKILNFKIGDFNNTIRGGNTVILRYVYNALIDTINIKHTREVDDDDDDEETNTSNDASSRNGIVLVGGKHIVIKNVYISRVGWYGLSYEGCIENLKIYDFECHFARHSMSANWFNHPHEPRDVYVHNARSFESTLTGFDTHDVGYNINYENVISIGSKKDAGFQFRTSNITLKNCVSRGNKIGIVARSSTSTTRDSAILLAKRKLLQNYKIENCDIQDNERSGISMSCNANIINTKIINNGFTESFSGGLIINGGLVKDCLIENNNFCAIIYSKTTDWGELLPEKLVIDSLTANANSTQTRLFSGSGAGTGSDRFNLLELRNSEVKGYSLSQRFYGNTDYPRNEKFVKCANNLWGNSKLYGEFNLVSGQQYISNNNTFNSNVLLFPINTPITNGIVNKSLDGVALGTGIDKLPNTWTQGGTGLSPLVLEVVGFTQNSLEPYVDIRVSGTASVSQFNLYFMDRYDKNRRPVTIQNNSWSLKVKLNLLSGSMTNVTNSFYIVEYDDIVSPANTSVVATTIGSSVVITNTETEFTRTYVINNINTTSFLYGLRFNTTIGGQIDCTIRIKNPSAVLGATIPIIQSTLVTELREPNGFVVTSYNSDGSINTNDNRKCNYVF